MTLLEYVLHTGLGSVRYQIYTQDQSERLEMINQFVRESQGVNFTGTWALTVEWNKVRSYDQVDFNANPSSFEGETAEFLKSVSLIARAILILNLLLLCRPTPSRLQSLPTRWKHL